MAHARKFQPITRPARIAPKQTGTAAAASALCSHCSTTHPGMQQPQPTLHIRQCATLAASSLQHNAIDRQLPPCLPLSLSLSPSFSLPAKSADASVGRRQRFGARLRRRALDTDHTERIYGASGTLCRTTSAHSRTTSPSDRV